MAEYSWSEADAASRRRLAMNAATLDPGTAELLEGIGVGPRWRCAEIGAGVGTVVRWLSERVGSAGEVIATDLDTRWIADLSSATVEVKVQDITVESPSEGDLDLVHARMVLTHLRDPARALANMLGALRPGGWILLEEPDQGPPFGRCIPDEPAVGRFVEALRTMIEKGGGDPDFGRRLPTLVRGVGLSEVVLHVRYIPMTVDLVVSTVDAARDVLIAMGAMSPAELDAVLSFVQDPSNLMYGAFAVASWARKPF